MPTVRGKADVDRFIGRIPADLEQKVLRGAARAAARIVADEAKQRSVSREVSDAIITRSKSEPGRIVVKITVKPGWPYSVGNWLEWGTSPHFISVDESQREGRSVGRINKLAREGSLVIGGKFVGATVHHPGASPHPFLRPALDIKGGEAIAAAQTYINNRVTRSGIVGSAEPEGGDE
jgi:hypothetical protein